MVNSVQKKLGYRDIIYNVKTDEFFTVMPGDNYEKLDIETGGAAEVPSGGTDQRPEDPITGNLYWDTDLEILLIWDGSAWVPIEKETEAVLDRIILIDQGNSSQVELSVKDGALIVTNPFLEVISEVDLGGTTPDPGNMAKVSLDGSGRYTTGINANQLNNNGLVTLEYINSPGQFFVIEDIDGGVFGPGDRQGFGLVRETIVDRTDLDGAAAVFAGGNRVVGLGSTPGITQVVSPMAGLLM